MVASISYHRLCCPILTDNELPKKLNPEAMTERWYSVDEVATHLGIGRDTVYRWIDRRDLPAHRIGKFWKFKISEVDAWVHTGAAASDSATEVPEDPES